MSDTADDANCQDSRNPLWDPVVGDEVADWRIENERLKSCALTRRVVQVLDGRVHWERCGDRPAGGAVKARGVISISGWRSWARTGVVVTQVKHQNER